MSRLAALPAATALLLSSAVSVSADPGPADPGGVTPVAATAPGPAAPPPVGAVPPPVDDGRIASSPPATSTLEGVTLTISSSNETVTPIAPLTTAVSTREYLVGGLFTGSIAGASAPPEGVFEVGYQIGCGIDMSTGGGVLIGATYNGGIGSDAFLGGVGGFLFPPIGLAGFGNSLTVPVAVSLKTGFVTTIPVDKKTYKTPAPEVKVTGFRVKIDGCVGQSFIRSYATLTNSTSEIGRASCRERV